MPGLSGLDLRDALAGAGRRMSIVFVTGHIDVPGSVRAMKHGAVDLLTKPVDAKELLAAIQRALAKDLRDRAAEARLASIHERTKMLTQRETEVFAFVVTGMLNKQIAFRARRGRKDDQGTSRPGHGEDAGRLGGRAGSAG